MYHNVPGRSRSSAWPRSARSSRRSCASSAAASLDVVAAVAEPGLVIAERIDRFETNSGRRVELPVTGVFVVAGGKIARFSDYFDLASFERQSGMKL